MLDLKYGIEWLTEKNTNARDMEIWLVTQLFKIKKIIIILVEPL